MHIRIIIRQNWNGTVQASTLQINNVNANNTLFAAGFIFIPIHQTI